MKILTITMLFFFVLKTYGQNAKNSYKLSSTINVGDSLKWDYLTADTVNNHLFISHQTKTIVIDLLTEKLIGEINPTPGVHGIAIDYALGKGFISNGKTSTITVFDLKTLKVLATVPAGGDKPDAIMYDMFSNAVIISNNGGNSISIFDPESLQVKKVIGLPGAPETAVSDQHGSIYVNIEDKGLVVKIDAVKQTVISKWDLNPGKVPTGLAIDIANGLLFSGCRENKSIEVVDVKTGKIVSTLPIEGRVDAVFFDPHSQYIFSSNGEGTVSVYQEMPENKFDLIQTIATKPGCKTMTVDMHSHKLYVPVMGTKENGNAKSFQVFVYSKL